jgi:hypothetical protein
VTGGAKYTRTPGLRRSAKPSAQPTDVSVDSTFRPVCRPPGRRRLSPS